MDEQQNGEVTEKTVSEGAASTVKGQNGGNKKTILSILIVVVLVFGALEFTGTTNILSGNKAVATINGEKITQKEFDTRFDQILASPQAATLDLDNPELVSQIKEQVLNEIINTKLLLQVAAGDGFTTTDEEVTAEYDLIVESLGGATRLAEELKNSNLTEKAFRKNIADQLVIQQYINTNSDADSLVVTDEEVATFYSNQISGQEGAPSLSEIEQQIKGQLLSNKQQAVIGELIASLLATADIEIAE